MTGELKTPQTQRIESLDALRGVAVLGIFVINILGFGLGETAFANPILSGGGGWLNNALWTGAKVFVDGSMRGLFSMMFGAGIVLFTARAMYPDGPIRIADLYYRRTLLLILFGLVHSYLLLGPGDILMIYGIAGIFLFPFRILSPRKLAIIGVSLLALLMLDALDYELAETDLGREATEVAARLEMTGEAPTDEEESILSEWQETIEYNWPPAEALAQERANRTGDIATLFSSNAKWVEENSGFIGLSWWVVDAMAMMFIGMALFKLGVLTNERSLACYFRLALIGYGIGLSLRTVWMIGRWQVEFSPILWAWGSFDQIARVAITFGHIGAFFCVWKIASGTAVLNGLVATGRMALTNYLGQTIIANILFSGIGFGLYMSLTMSEVYGAMVLIWIAQILFSVWWMGRYHFGPFEWLWRSLTYGEKPKLRRQ